MKSCKNCKHRTIFYNCKKWNTSCELALSYSRQVCCSSYYDWEYKKTIIDKIKKYLFGTEEWWNNKPTKLNLFLKKCKTIWIDKI